MDTQAPRRIAAEDYLDALAAHGIDHLFVNPGTDFAPIIEAFARAGRTNRKVPRPMVVPHEHAAVAMAHGYTLVTGRPQAVMLHVNVGLANSINALIDASRDRVPLLLTSGRTPITEEGPHGARSVYIHWAQEMFDQAGMLREFVKWDYEMKRGDQVNEVVDRALELAETSPTGPVYLALPREVLGEELEARADTPRRPRARPEPPRAAARDIATAADWIAAARAPLVITGQLGRDPREAVLLTQIAERFALPVVPFNARHFAISGAHPMFQGGAAGSLLTEADLILVLESDVPWIPSLSQPGPDARIIQVGEDPLYQRYPMRSFRSDLTVRSSALGFLQALEPALAQATAASATDIAARKESLTARSAELRRGWAAEVEQAGRAETISLAWLNHCLRAVVETDTVVVNEYSFRQEILPSDRARKSLQRWPCRWAGLGLPRRPRHQARLAREAGGRAVGRRGLHVLQPDRVPLHRAEPEPAAADGHL